MLPLAADTVSIRSLDWDRDRFDIEFGLENGTTYNAYLIFGEKVALVDASHEKFHDLFLEELDRQLKAAGKGHRTTQTPLEHTLRPVNSRCPPP